MKNTLLAIALLLFGSSMAQEKIQWMSIEEAYELTRTGKSKKTIDVYTDWCGWCKRMDKATFPARGCAYMNEHYNVKFNAEQKEDITILNNTFTFVAQGQRGYHELAAALLNGKMSYPTVIFMNDKFEMLSPVPGYQEPVQFLKIANFFGSNAYKDTPWEEYAEAIVEPIA